MSAPTPLSNIGDEIADVADLGIRMFRDVGRGDLPTLYDADELVRKAELVRELVRAEGLRRLTDKPLGDLVEIDDAGAQVEMAAQHHARADRLQVLQGGKAAQ